MRRRTLTIIAATFVFLSAAARAQVSAVYADYGVPVEVPKGEPPPPPSPSPSPPVVPASATAGAVNRFALQLYGFAELDSWYDNVLNANEGVGNGIIAKPDTQAGSHGRWVWTARNSRFGFRINAPPWEDIRASANIEGDFGGTGPAGGNASPVPYSNVYGNEAAYTLNGVFRLRHAYVKLETAYFDVTAGQTWDLFGWGVVPFLGNTPEYQGITGQILHRNPIIKLQRKFKTDPVDIVLGIAAVRPFQRDSQIPDAQAGIKLELPGWTGVHSIGAGKPLVDAAAVAISGMYRSFRLPPFTLPAGSTAAPTTYQYVSKAGYGVSLDLFLPIYGATIENQSNAVAFTGEATYTVGLSDLFSNLSAGLPGPAPWIAANPTATPPQTMVPYPQNFDNNVLAWNPMTMQLVPVKWAGLTVGLQYHLPVYDGKLMWLSTNFGTMRLMDSASYGLTAMVRGSVVKSNMWNDGTLFVSLGPAAQIALNYVTYQVTFQDDSKSTRLQRIMYAMFFFF